MSEGEGERAQERFVTFVVRVDAGDPSAAERAAAEAWSGGAVGIEERGERAEIIVVHAPASLGEAIAAECAQVPGVAHVGAISVTPHEHWSEAWKAGLDAIVVSSRLVVRPPFVAYELAPGQREVVIDPGQAFGTGQHQSTRLMLGWIDTLLGERREPTDSGGCSVLDVGTGSGVLALAALELGASPVAGFDLDPLATHAAEQAARENGHVARFEITTGGIECFAGRRFDLVLANLLRGEMLPIVPQLAAVTAPSGALVLGGLLESDRARISEAFAPEGFAIVDQRVEVDADAARWVGWLLRRSAGLV